MARVPTADDISAMERNISDSLVPDIIACTSISGIASILIVTLRFASRNISNTGLQASDWLILVAWVFFITFDICFATSVKYGAGRHAILVTNGRLLQIINLIDENLYMFAMAFIKFSILSLYISIFPQKTFRRLGIALTIFISAWAISSALVSTLQCLPIAYGWDPTVPGGHCINYGLLVLVTGILNVITDFVILTMPIPLVLKLQMSKQKKWLVIITFMMGGSACIVSVVRLAYTLRVGSTVDGSWDSIPAGMASVAELLVGMLASSLPAYIHLYRRFVGKAEGKPIKRSYDYPLLDHNRELWRTVNITASGQIANTGPGAINVTDQIDMETCNKTGDGWLRVPNNDENSAADR